MLNPPGSTPAWASNERTSCLVFVSWFILYVLCPFFLTILFIETSCSCKEKTFWELSKMISTDASFAGPISLVPKNIRLPAFAARNDFMLILPRTKHIASETLLFPLPFGPRMTFIPGVKGISVFLGKLLKPCITSLLMYIKKESRGKFLKINITSNQFLLPRIIVCFFPGFPGFPENSMVIQFFYVLFQEFLC